jgi:hypothetical protein
VDISPNPVTEAVDVFVLRDRLPRLTATSSNLDLNPKPETPNQTSTEDNRTETETETATETNTHGDTLVLDQLPHLFPIVRVDDGCLVGRFVDDHWWTFD